MILVRRDDATCVNVDRHNVPRVRGASQDVSNPQSYSLGSRRRSRPRPRCTRLAYRVSRFSSSSS